MNDTAKDSAGRDAGGHSFQGRRVLVTGASGFIGSAVAAQLVNEGAEVHTLARRSLPTPAGVAGSHAVDICNADELRRAFIAVAPECVFHLAGYSYGARGVEHVQPALMVNLVAAIQLLTLATEAGGVRVILAGSQEEAFPHDGPAASYVPNSPYGASKYACSSYARMFHRLYGLPVTVGRILTAYGAGQREFKKLLPYVILAFLRGEAPKLSSAKRPMDWIYIDDVAEGLLAAARSPDTAGKTIDIGTGTTYTGREMIEKIAEIMQPASGPLFGALPDRPMEDPVVADAAATRAALGWQAHVDMEEGLRRTIAWYQEAVNSGLIDNSSSEPKLRHG